MIKRYSIKFLWYFIRLDPGKWHTWENPKKRTKAQEVAARVVIAHMVALGAETMYYKI